MKDLVAKGWMTENGFKHGYLQKLEAGMQEKLPGTDIRRDPHIASRISIWKKFHGSLLMMLKENSGIGFNASTGMIDCHNDAWENICKAHITAGVYAAWMKDKNCHIFYDWSTRAKMIYNYVTGRYPTNNHGIHWSEALAVYGVGNIFGNHWFLYEIRIQEKKIILYNSLSEGRPSAVENAIIRRLATVLPSICSDLHIFNENSTCGPQETDMWAIERYVGTPQQTNFSDCGVMCVKMFECFVNGVSIHDIDPKQCSRFRKDYCAELSPEEVVQ